MRYYKYVIIYLVFIHLNHIYAQNINLSLDNNELKLHIPAKILTNYINNYLNNSKDIPTQIVNNRTEKGKIHSFKTYIHNNKIRVHFKYKYETRACTYRPIVSGWWCTRWVSDSGWSEIDLRFYHKNTWEFGVYNLSNEINVNSNNWLTETLIKPFIISKVRLKVSENINNSINSFFHGSTINLQNIVISQGSQLLSNKFNIPIKRVQIILEQYLKKVKFKIYFNNRGLFWSTLIPREIKKYITQVDSNTKPKPNQIRMREIPFFCSTGGQLHCQKFIQYYNTNINASYQFIGDHLNYQCKLKGFLYAIWTYEIEYLMQAHRKCAWHY